MAGPDQLRLKDLRTIYRLVGECRELGSDSRAWRLHMLEGLRKLVGAQVALCMRMEAFGGGDERVSEPLDAEFLDCHERSLWAHYVRKRAHLDDPFDIAFLKDVNGPLKTRRLDSVIEGDEWYRSRHYNDYVRACRLDDRITSSLRLPGGSQPTYQVIVLHRSAADGKYSRRNQRLVHLFHHELGTLVGRPLTMPVKSDDGPALPFRLRQVLGCLLQGDSEKRIAARLGISPHTVNRHVQRLYREFGVHSRAELLCRAVRCSHDWQVRHDVVLRSLGTARSSASSSLQFERAAKVRSVLSGRPGI